MPIDQVIDGIELIMFPLAILADWSILRLLRQLQRQERAVILDPPKDARIAFSARYDVRSVWLIMVMALIATLLAATLFNPIVDVFTDSKQRMLVVRLALDVLIVLLFGWSMWKRWYWSQLAKMDLVTSWDHIERRGDTNP